MLCPDLAEVASGVLYNLLNDYGRVPPFCPNLGVLIVATEPAQRACSSMLFQKCFFALKDSMIQPNDGAYFCACENLHTILQALNVDELLTREQDFLLNAIAFVDYVKVIEDEIEHCDHYLPLLSSCLILLRSFPTRQDDLHTTIYHVLFIFQNVSKRLEKLPSRPDDEENQSLLEAARGELLEFLCHIASSTTIATLRAQECTILSHLRCWLAGGEQKLPTACVECASLFLGNIAHDEAACEILVREQSIHTLLIGCLKTHDDRRVLHAVGGCLRNIAVPAKNKEIIAQAGAFEALMYLLRIQLVQELPYLGACIIRQLVNGSFSNVQLLVSKAYTHGEVGSGQMTYLEILLECSYHSDDFAVKAETARTLAAIFRTLSTAKEPQDKVESVLRKTLSHANLLSLIEAVLRQDQHSPLRSEGWFTLALIAQSNEGARTVAKLLEDDQMLRLLHERINIVQTDNGSGESSVQSDADKQRQNGILLITSLMQKNGAWEGGSMPNAQVEKLVAILKEQGVELSHE